MTETDGYGIKPLLGVLTEMKSRLEIEEVSPETAIQTAEVEGLFFYYLKSNPNKIRGSRREAVISFCDHIIRLSTITPDPAEIARAPHLDFWCAIRSSDHPRLVGRVNGHPSICNNSPTRTSPVLWISDDGAWARTYNRVYSLGKHDTLFCFEMVSDGLLPVHSEIIR